MSTERRAPSVRPIVPPAGAPASKNPVSWSEIFGRPENLDSLIGTKAKPSTGPLEIHAKGNPPLILQRNETTAALLKVIEFKRDGVIKGYLGLDIDDHLVVIAKDGTTPIAEFDTDATENFALQLHQPGAAGLKLFLALKRDTAAVGYLGINAADGIVVYGADGVTVLLTIGDTATSAEHFIASIDVKAGAYLDGGGLQVVGSREGPIADGTATSGSSTFGGTTGGSPSDPATLGDVQGALESAGVANGNALDALGTATTALGLANSILGALRGHGLIAP